jgi:hypothetical protein
MGGVRRNAAADPRRHERDPEIAAIGGAHFYRSLTLFAVDLLPLYGLVAHGEEIA